MILISVYRSKKQGDEAAIHVCFPSYITSMEQESGSHLDGKLFLSASKYSLYSSMEKNLLLCINTMECIWTKIIYSYFLYELHRILPLGGCGSHYTLMGSIPVNGQILCSCSNYRGSHTNCIFLCFITRHCCLLLQLCFVRQFGSSIQKSDYLALRLGFITVGTQCFGFPFLLFSLSLPSICEFLLLVRYISFLTGI